MKLPYIRFGSIILFYLIGTLKSVLISTWEVESRYFDIWLREAFWSIWLEIFIIQIEEFVFL